MSIINFLITNWESVLVVVIMVAVVTLLIVKKQWAVLDKMLIEQAKLERGQNPALLAK